METQQGNFKVIGTRPIRHDGEDKVTGRAIYGADVAFPDQLHGKVLRSPHPHARIVSIDTSRAEALPGVEAIITNADFPRLEEKVVDTGEGTENLKYMSDRILAGAKVLFKGHPIAAVAANDPWIAEEACGLIEVKYEKLKAITDVLEAMAPEAPPLHDTITTTTLGKKEKKATNVATHTRHKRGDVEAGFKECDLVLEREFRTKTVHQGYIEPQNATALARSDGQITVWTSTQGPFPAREQLATILQVPLSQVRVMPQEIGGGFGGKIPVYLEPLAAMLSRKTGRPVKMVMSRADVFQATGPASSTVTRIKIGVKKDGTVVAGQAWMAYEAGAFPNTWSMPGSICVLSSYKFEHVLVDAFDVMTNTTKVAAYRSPSTPQALFGVESIMDEIAQQLGMDPLELRIKNAVQEGDLRTDGLKFKRVGFVETLEAVKKSPHYQSPAPEGPNRARAVAAGFWFNASFASSATVGINMDGTANVVTGSVDIGGSRVAMAIMAAEALGLKPEEVRPSVADTGMIGHTDVTAGSRVTAVTGTAVFNAAQDAIGQMKQRVAKLWDTEAGKILFEDGAFRHADGGHDPLTVKDLAPKLAATGGPVLGSGTAAPKAVGAGFGVHLVDIEIDPETGKLTILRYTAAQDVGRAIHPAYVEGQIQGGTIQGIGWALNEEYVVGDDGVMQNATFLDYRMPTAL
ncbi:MAG: xanthine dehydrogenase family protein molybdopterin-binding subunit, partial [bacterium]